MSEDEKNKNKEERGTVLEAEKEWNGTGNAWKDLSAGQKMKQIDKVRRTLLGNKGATNQAGRGFQG